MSTSLLPALMLNISDADQIRHQQDMDWNTSEVLLLNNSSGVYTNASQEEESFYQTFSWSSEFMMRYSPTISTVYCVAYTIVFVMGIIGNSCVVAVVVRSPRMRTVTNYFIVNLALADILVVLFCLPATLLSNLFIRKFCRLFHFPPTQRVADPLMTTTKREKERVHFNGDWDVVTGKQPGNVSVT